VGVRPLIYTVGPYSQSRGNLVMGAEADDCRYLTVRHRHLILLAVRSCSLLVSVKCGPNIMG
jgi:hypothetical protein